MPACLVVAAAAGQTNPGWQRHLACSKQACVHHAGAVQQAGRAELRQLGSPDVCTSSVHCVM